MFQAMLEAGAAIPRSLAIAFCAVLLGLIVGPAIALLRFYRVPVFGRAGQIVITIAKGFPVVLVYFMLFIILAPRAAIPVEIIILLGIAIGTSIEISEAVRGAMESVEKSQFDAALSIGHTGPAILFRVVLPQIVPVCVPVMGNVVIHAIKALPVGSMIGLHDILSVALSAAVINYRYLESYIAAALIFWAIFIIVEKSFSLVEKKFSHVKV
ncbi:MAG: ABC transporter permease subunit [Treponema sp.]|jgi:L-cystine transport system permease protein|nr:ABC transporter permease subunit [Treponema sp.]